MERRRLRTENRVCIMATEGLNAALDVHPRAIFRVATVKVHDTSYSRSCSIVVLGVFSDFFFLFGRVLKISDGRKSRVE